MTSSAPGDLLDLDVTGFAHGGTAVARHEGRVVFVADAIPGERVRARITDAAKAAFWRADTVEVLDASPHRRAHVWAEADVARDPAERPGGADLGHIEISHQRALKQQVLQEALDRFGGGGVPAPAVEGVEPDLRWRTRLSLHVDGDGRIGPFAARSHRVIDVAGHPLATPAIEEAAQELAERRGRSFAGIRRLDLVQPADGEVRLIAVPERERPQRRPAGRGRGPRPRRAPRPVAEVVHEKVGDRTFSVDVDGFWQVHPQAALTLDAAVRQLLAPVFTAGGVTGPSVDLYGGVGLFAATLEGLGAERITTVESAAGATRHAADNLAPGTRAVTARVDRFLHDAVGADESWSGGAVVLDPPRSGAGREVVDALATLDAASVVYVACDPVAFARDLRTFRDHGYALDGIRAFDLFPHTHHFETVALLRR